jgi:hypothetical protein
MLETPLVIEQGTSTVGRGGGVVKNRVWETLDPTTRLAPISKPMMPIEAAGSMRLLGGGACVGTPKTQSRASSLG